MSASSRPTRARAVFSASARLTAVVDLPTPPLPLATATMAWHAGHQGLGRRCLRPAAVAALVPHEPVRRGAGALPAGRSAVSTAETESTPGKATDGLLRRRAQPLQLGRARPVDLDGEGDMAAAQRQARNHAEIDDIASAIGIGDGLEGGQHSGLACLGHA